MTTGATVRRVNRIVRSGRHLTRRSRIDGLVYRLVRGRRLKELDFREFKGEFGKAFERFWHAGVDD